jgi:tyrosyl-tRNA synthetase
MYEELVTEQPPSISYEVPFNELPVVTLLCDAGLAESRNAARRLIQQGGAYINDQEVTSVDAIVTEEDFGPNNVLVARAGKRKQQLVILNKGVYSFTC